MPTQTRTRALPPVALSASLLWLALVALLLAHDAVAAFGTEAPGPAPVIATE